MMKRKAFVISLLPILLIASGFWIWRTQEARAKEEQNNLHILRELTPDDISNILQSQMITDRSTVELMNADAGARRTFLDKMRGVLAFAAQARRDGLADSEAFKANFEIQKNQLLASHYAMESDKEKLKPILSPESYEAVWAVAENEEKFKSETELTDRIQLARLKAREMSQPPKAALQGEKLERARKEWARTKILSDTAKSVPAFIERPIIQIRLRILEAGILATDYLDTQWKGKVKANDDEIRGYLAEHPEFDVGKKKQTAELVLNRALAGEDFQALAREFSEDRSTKGKGGLYENVDPQILWPEVVNAAIKLGAGEISSRIVESETGFHIVKLEAINRKTNKVGSEATTISVRHVLLQKAFEDPIRKPDVPPPYLPANEIARSEIERTKLSALVRSLSEQNNISLPEDFAVNLTGNSIPSVQ